MLSGGFWLFCCCYLENLFNLDEFTGRLFSSQEFDREARSSYRLVIQAFRLDHIVSKRHAEDLQELSYSQLRLINRLNRQDYEQVFDRSEVSWLLYSLHYVYYILP